MRITDGIQGHRNVKWNLCYRPYNDPESDETRARDI